ncbi:tetratricopeptide repeat protein [Candidatus Marinimicrobia bacterium]|jgi:tetratricopeptide (TPR) repeat protein/class 3 adenylate cyclase|nr:tetratricopeptide repeat protein [Candidatus Neomarinimicrobiota bacterium]MDC0383953.1 tetratricopeptide repeat protein [Candidatus Neomarinimicrobiota bacterium]
MSEPIHKLAVIVFTDIVGFTKLTAEDQQKASDLLDLQRKEFLPLVKAFQGKWVKEVGDGLILTFDTVQKAVHCCIKIQEKAKEIDDLNLRIGIHLGEILEKENDIIGDDVNITARIEPFSATGGIAISNKINDALIRESQFKTKYLGKPKLKGVGQTVEVYCIISHGLPPTNLSKVSAKLERENKFLIPAISSFVVLLIAVYYLFFMKPNIESIAVLYMKVSGGEDLSYIEAITEDLIFDLSSSTNGLLKVSEPASVKKYKNNDLEFKELGQKLDVKFIFQSSIQPDGDGFNLRCRLVEAKTGEDRFINKWFIESQNLQSIVGVLAENIIDELEVDKKSDMVAQQYDPKAYELYLKSKTLFAKSKSSEDSENSIEMMLEATRIDNNLIGAKLFLGLMYEESRDYENANKLYSRALSQSKTIGDNAIIAEALRKQGKLSRKEKDFDGAIEKFNESLSIAKVMNDKNAMAKTLNSIAILYYRTDKKEEALQNWLEALKIAEEFDDKLKTSKYLNNLGIWYEDDANFSRSIEYYNKSLVIKEELADNRNYSKTLHNLGQVYFEMGDYVNAIDHYNKSIEMKNELNDLVGLNKSIVNKAKSYFFQLDYDNSMKEIKAAIKLSKNLKRDKLIVEKNRFLGMIYFHQSMYDSSLLYLNKVEKLYEKVPPKSATVMPFIAASLFQKGDRSNAEIKLMEFNKIIEENDLRDSDIILVNWSAYSIYDSLGESKKAKNSLENAYFEIKSKSKEIKNKDDRKLYLSTEMNKNILSRWKSI